MARRGLAVLAAGLVLLSCGGALDRQGVVSGGIIPCSGLPVTTPHNAAGTVSALKGRITWRPVPHGQVSVFPTAIAAQEMVGQNATYRLVLDPGPYVLQAGYGFTEITVQPGDDIYVDIPNMCI